MAYTECSHDSADVVKVGSPRVSDFLTSANPTRSHQLLVQTYMQHYMGMWLNNINNTGYTRNWEWRHAIFYLTRLLQKESIRATYLPHRGNK